MYQLPGKRPATDGSQCNEKQPSASALRNQLHAVRNAGQRDSVYFYPGGGTTEGENAPDIEEYKSSGTSMPIGDWRRRNVNDMVADVYNAIQ